MKKIFIASDHAGYNLKQNLLNNFPKILTNLGTNSDQSVDYPDFAHKIASNIVEDEISAVLICGSGIGMSIVANRYKNVRAALCLNENITIISNRNIEFRRER